jgi:hypothetical protein
MMTIELIECDICYMLVPEDSIENIMIFAGTREEPPEYENICSLCVAEHEPDYESMVQNER